MSTSPSLPSSTERRLRRGTGTNSSSSRAVVVVVVVVVAVVSTIYTYQLIPLLESLITWEKVLTQLFAIRIRDGVVGSVNERGVISGPYLTSSSTVSSLLLLSKNHHPKKLESQMTRLFPLSLL